MTPACMTPDELRLWEDANRQTKARADRPCRDCPMAFARSMKAIGCCNGEPLEGHMGRSPDEKRTRIRDQWRRAAARYRTRKGRD